MKTEIRLDIIDKMIYEEPIPINLDFVSPYMRGSTLKRLDDERLVIRQTTIGWIELMLCAFSIWSYSYVMGKLDERVSERLADDKILLDYEDFFRNVNEYDTIKYQLSYLDHETYNVVDTFKIKKKFQLSAKKQERVARYKELGEERYREYIKDEFLDIGAERFGMYVSIGLIITFALMGFPRIKRFVFNRKTGEVTYPRVFGLGSYTRPFSEVNFILARLGMRASERKSLAILHPNGVTRTFINYQYPERFLSFYVWYMDKNRPLSPGTAFDPYRERDYDRRKAEGFPAPLYTSIIDTLEWEPGDDLKKREEYHKHIETLMLRANKYGYR